MTAELYIKTVSLSFIYKQYAGTKLYYLLEDLKPGDNYTLDVSKIYLFYNN